MGYHDNFARTGSGAKRAKRGGIEGLEKLLFGRPTDEREEWAPDARLVAIGKALLRLRRERESQFGNDLFADPSWDLLLDLFVCELQFIRVTISSACVAACAPQTTGLRHLKTLESRCLVRRTDDPLDKRVSYVELTAPARRMMADLLTSFREAACAA